VFLPRVLEALRASEGVGEVVVVVGAHPLPSNTVLLSAVRAVGCAGWERGPGASLRCGLAALPDGATHALVVLADGPELDPRAVARVLEHRGDADVVAASYGGARSHPLVLARAAWEAVPDEGLRGLPVRLVDCSDLRPPGDVDFADTGREQGKTAED
jgi:nicotine blue oxidoreductase